MLATASESTLTYVDSDVTHGTGYTYAVRAFNDQGVSASSNLVPAAPYFGPASEPRCGTADSAYQALIAKTPGLAGYWRLGDGASSPVCEVTGRSDGAYIGAAAPGAPAGLSGDADTAADFDGSTGFVRVRHRSSLSLGDAFTLEAWVKRASADGASSQGIVSKQAGSWVLMFSAKDRLVLRRSNDANVAVSTATVEDTASWHHVVATKSGGTVRLFIDGADVTGRITNLRMANNTKPLVIGKASATGSSAVPSTRSRSTRVRSRRTR
jgi:hypothetical protein